MHSHTMKLLKICVFTLWAKSEQSAHYIHENELLQNSLKEITFRDTHTNDHTVGRLATTASKNVSSSTSGQEAAALDIVASSMFS